MKTLTEKINEATKKAHFLLKASKLNLTAAQFETLQNLCFSVNFSSEFNLEWRSLPVLKRKGLIDDKLNIIY